VIEKCANAAGNKNTAVGNSGLGDFAKDGCGCAFDYNIRRISKLSQWQYRDSVVERRYVALRSFNVVGRY
tara:strand:- start:217 stop:426 length:210 start_codon:yes stop_codon:yes gene_type:complete